MRISLLTIGSRGDVQPLVGLGACLAARGHTVELATGGEFAWMAREAGLGYRQLPDEDSGEIMRRPEVVAAIRKGPSLTRVGRAIQRTSGPAADPEHLLAEVSAAMAGADLVITSWMTKMACLFGPEVPWLTLSTWPRVPTRQFPALGWPSLPLGGRYNLLTHHLWAHLEWQLSRPVVNRLRARAGQPSLGTSSPFRDDGLTRPILHPVSPEVLPCPADWPAEAHLTGYLFWDRDQPVSRPVADFVGAGAEPVVLVLGGYAHIYPSAEIISTVVSVARRSGRGVVLVGGPRDHAADDVYHVTEVDYGWLFARAAAVVHYGGLGTTGEAVRAGVPQVVMPSFSDQPFWAGQVHRIGIAAAPVPLTTLTADRLGRAVEQALTDQQMIDEARRVGAKVRAEDGNGTAAKIVETWAARQP